MALEARLISQNVERVILEERPEGVYVLAFKPDELWLFQDHLQDDWALARLQALEDFGITYAMWMEIPDTHIME
jgi:hypothetical protein